MMVAFPPNLAASCDAANSWVTGTQQTSSDSQPSRTDIIRFRTDRSSFTCIPTTAGGFRPAIPKTTHRQRNWPFTLLPRTHHWPVRLWRSLEMREPARLSRRIRVIGLPQTIRACWPALDRPVAWRLRLVSPNTRAERRLSNHLEERGLDRHADAPHGSRRSEDT